MEQVPWYEWNIYCAQMLHAKTGRRKGVYMKVTIDRKQCVSCGSCWDSCPDLFVQNEKDSFSQIVPEYQENGDPAKSTEIPDTTSCARDAADLCPATIITIVE